MMSYQTDLEEKGKARNTKGSKAANEKNKLPNRSVTDLLFAITPSKTKDTKVHWDRDGQHLFDSNSSGFHTRKCKFNHENKAFIVPKFLLVSISPWLAPSPFLKSLTKLITNSNTISPFLRNLWSCLEAFLVVRPRLEMRANRLTESVRIL